MITPPTKPAFSPFRLIVAGSGAIFLLVSTFLAPPTHWESLVLSIFIAFQVYYPLSLFNTDIHLAQVITISAGLVFGPAAAGWAVLPGIAVGLLLRQASAARFRLRSRHLQAWALETAYNTGLQITPLTIALMLTGWERGVAGLPTISWLTITPPLLLFAFLHSALVLADAILHSPSDDASVRRGLLTLLTIEFLPLPFLATTPLAYQVAPIGLLIAIGGIPTLLTQFIYRMSAARIELERRVQELSTLDTVSSVLRSTLNLDELLTAIHQQVTQLMGVDHFYVAIYDVNEGRLWYPLAVKYGKRQNWPPRQLLHDRLTDRVIRIGKPILITPQNRDDLAQTGLPTSVDIPQAWLGVPLITSERTIGCLAIYSISPLAQFTPQDLNLVTILSGQVSVAIQNALLYDQAQRRALQLEKLNRITALITASLNTEEVLDHVCRSVTEVGSSPGNTPRSAIFLLDSDNSQVTLAHAQGLSADFARINTAFPLEHDFRARCLHSSKPALTADIHSAPLESDILLAFKKEGILAYGDFPLTTPNGATGILSVYFDAIHHFHPEEVELLQTFAAQAALAVANARLYASTDQALARRVDQLSILESVGRELAAAIGSSRLFDRIIDYALQFTQSPWGELSLFNPQSQTLTVRASRGYHNAAADFTLNDGLSGRAIRLRQPVNVGNTRAEPGYIDLTGGQSRSQLSIPLIHEGRVLGVLTIESPQENAYSASDQAFISQLATQAAVAVVNAELYHETQRRLREQSILFLISTHLAASNDLDTILQTAIRSVDSAMPGVTVGVYLWEESLHAYLSRHASPSPNRPACQLPAAIPAARVESLRPALNQAGLLHLTQKSADAAVFLGNCAGCQALAIPMVVKQQPLGLALIHVDENQALSDEEKQLLQAMIAQAAISVQNALLFLDTTHARDRLAAVLNSVDEGLIMLESSGRVLLANQPVERITGLPFAALNGILLPDLPGHALKTLGYTRSEANALAHSLGSGQAFNSPKITLHLIEQKPERVVERSTLPVWGQGGQVIGWMIVLRDVTEEFQLAEERELITETLVHDLRSPVSAVLGAVDILQEELPNKPSDELLEQAFRVARGSATRVLGLIESLLDISRMKAGKIELNLSPISLQTLAASAIAEFLAHANEIGVILRNDVPANLPEIHADQSKITRVITNLLDNALKFTPAGGWVSISGSQAPTGMIALQIADTGPGIPAEYREKIFDRFTQVPGQRGRRRGSGLGLTFCRLAIEAHGGKIWAEERPNGGSIFTFTLPVSGQ